MSGKGGFADGVWNGTIGDLFIDDTANINLQLDTPVNVSASAQGFKLDRCACTARWRACAARRVERTGGTRVPMRTICRSAR
jgi:hypothetical protein